MKTMKFSIKQILSVSPVFKQFMTIICCGFAIFGFSSLFGWVTINSVELQDKNSTYGTGPLSLQEVALIISMVNVGCLIGTFAVIPVIQTIGPKRTIQSCHIPLIMSALLIIFAKNIYYLYASRILIGLVCGGLPLAIATLINDICFNHIRGMLIAQYDGFFNFGFIASYFFGNVLSYVDQAIACLIVPCIFIIVLFFLPESPEFLSKCGKQHQANKSRTFYKGITDDNNGTDISTVDNREQVVEVNDKIPESNSSLGLRDFTTPEAKKACFISFTSFALGISAGTYAFGAYVADIFARTGSPLSAKSSSLLMAVITLIGNLVFLSIAERFSRKVLYVSSSIVTGLSYFAYGVYCLFWLQKPGFEWMPLLCFSVLSFACTLGLLPVPFIISAEIFPKKIRPICISTNICMMFIILYVYTLIIPIFFEEINLFWLMFFLGAVCVLNAIFGYFFMPDTRGKSHEEILDILNEKN